MLLLYMFLDSQKDLYVISLQEMVDLSAANVMMDSQSAKRAQVMIRVHFHNFKQVLC